MKVLFIGGTGTISSAVSRLAIERGIELYLLNRGNRTEFIPGGAHILQGDIRDEEATRELLKDKFFDAVVNWISFVPEHAETDIRLFAGKTGQYIYISSASAYQKPPASPIITEETPLINPYWEYSRNKIASEERLFAEYAKSGFPVTVVRPSHTYGDNSLPSIFNSRKHTWSIVERMRQGKKIVIPGDGTSLWVMTHNTDFAQAFVGLLGNSKAVGEAYTITSDEVLTWNSITRLLGEAAGYEPELVHLSTDFVTSCLPELHSELVGDKINSVIFDNSKIKALVPEYKAVKSFREGIRESVQWYLRHPELLKQDEEWDRCCDRLIAAHEAGVAHFRQSI
ncbi:MAG: NAD-dependent dehydratase [Paenibacillaceae bacterium]|jgi:nucleoside-diphosphate-sugar epimerase|nr:NAD-dependent dehydratase [Paenibacillaceae bacterium]